MNAHCLRKFTKKWLPSKVVHAIQQWLLGRSIAKYERHVVRHYYGNHQLSVCLGDKLAEGWYDHDFEEPEEIVLLKQWSLRPGALVFDLGAHQGVGAMLLAVECAPGGSVISVEGSLHNVLMARKNAEINQIESIHAIHAVVGDKHGGELLFSSTLNGHVQNNGGGERVPQVSIDGLAAQYGKPSLIFVDVEGYECQVLAGAHKVMETGVDCFVEVHVACGLEENGSVEKLLSFFREQDYELHISKGEGHPFVQWERGATFPDKKFFLAARFLHDCVR
jgi:FkbM family methyltransferase